jgi:hypothetical protein
MSEPRHDTASSSSRFRSINRAYAPVRDTNAREVGWVQSDSAKTLGPYAWRLRCIEHPPLDLTGWEPLPAGKCPTEAVCDECDEFLS